MFTLTAGVTLLGAWFHETPGVLLGTTAIIITNLACAAFVFRAALANLHETILTLRKIGWGDYTARVDATKNPDLAVINDMAKMLADRDSHITQRAYQTAVLREISERISESLTTEEILEITAGSLQKIVPYSTVSYIIINPDGTATLKCHLEDSVNKRFAEEAKKKMLFAIESVTGMHIPEEKIRTTYFGNIFDETARDHVRSFFNVPMVIDRKLVGIINVASLKPGLYTEPAVSILYNIVEHAGATIGKIRAIVAHESQKVDSMLASITDGVIMASTAGEMLVMNNKAQKILRLAEHQESMLDVIHSLYGIFDLRGAMDEVTRTKIEKSFPEISLEHAFYKITASPVLNSNNEIYAVAFVLSDITHEKEIDAMKSEFISTTSHQLRTPLSSMKWFLEMLLGSDLGTINEKQKEVLTDIYNSNERIITLVNDLLDVSRIESGKITLEPTPTNLVEFIRSMLPETNTMFKKRKQEFSFEYPEAMPRVAVDPKLIWQVLQNLLTNASKYTPENGKVTMTLSLEPDHVLLKVVDNGFGIPEFQKHRIFEKFFRADNVAKSDGTGLGLYIARQIAEASGGKLWFESTEGKGTTFFLTLPLLGSAPQKVIRPASF